MSKASAVRYKREIPDVLQALAAVHTVTDAHAVSFAYDEAGQTTNIYIMRNPDKLSHLGGSAIH